MLTSVRSHLAEGVDNLYIEITAETDKHTAVVRIENDHTNVTYVAVDGEIVSKTINEIQKAAKTEYAMTFDSIYEFLKRQIFLASFLKSNSK